MPLRRPRTAAALLGLALAVPLAATALTAAPALAATTAATPAATPAAAGTVLGQDTLVFDPSMPTDTIQAQVDAVAQQQLGNQFGRQRYALLFRPGTYGTPDHPLRFQVGYYTQVAGLGLAPGDVTINGSVDVHNQCDPDGTNCLALNNFWRSLSNLTIDLPPVTDCYSSGEFWAVSQASPMRRVQVNGGNVTLQDYCTAGPQYASGGFIADSAFSGGTVINGSQQQFYTRNSVLDGWTNGVWNQVFSGDAGAPPQSFGPDGAQPYTTLDATPVSREAPFLYTNSLGGFRVYVPSARTASSGTSWQSGTTAGRSLPLSSFYVAHPGDTAQQINAQLATGHDLLLTPGVYDVDQSIAITRPRTVVLGLGLATLTAQKGVAALTIGDVPGVTVSGITVDAGARSSAALVRVGTAGAAGKPAKTFPDEPTTLSDVFFRVGGPHAGKAKAALVVNSNGVLLDDVWAWRADHGQGVGWTVNTSDNGVVVNGDDVTATGLFVEHFQTTNVVWNGERGRTVFFQNELPYDAPDQASWSHDGEPGYPAYAVSPGVTTHEAWGLGSYIFTNVNPSLHAANGFEVPVTPGVQMHDLLTVSLNKAGTIDHVVNGVGDPVTPDHAGPSDVVAYP